MNKPRNARPADADVARQIAQRAAEALIGAASSDLPAELATIREKLTSLVEENGDNVGVVVAGSLLGSTAENGYTDVHIPLRGDYTLTVGLTITSQLPPILEPIDGFQPEIFQVAGMGMAAGTWKYDMTGTQTGSPPLPDSQGDSTPD